MRLLFKNGKYYMCDYDNCMGWWGIEITKEVYRELSKCNLVWENDMNEYYKELEE